MKTNFILIFLFLTGGIFSQQSPEFSFDLYFEDASGFKDTLILGYDQSATNGVDQAFGEINEISQPWSSNLFQVFLTNSGLEPTLKSKKQILMKPCGEDWQDWISRVYFISIKNAVFPIQLELSTDIYQNSCLNGSFLALDGDPWLKYSNFNNSITLVEPNYLNQYQDPIDGNLISYYWIILADSSQQSGILATESSVLPERINLFPNPFIDKITIPKNITISNILISDLNGKLIDFDQDKNSIYPKNCASGLYIVSFESNGEIIKFKIIKK